MPNQCPFPLSPWRQCQINEPSIIYSVWVADWQGSSYVWMRKIKMWWLLISWLIRLQGMGEHEAWKNWRGGILQSSTEVGQAHQNKGDRLLGTRLHYFCHPQNKFACTCHLGLQNWFHISSNCNKTCSKLSKCWAPIAFKTRTTQAKGLAMLRQVISAVCLNKLSYNSYKKEKARSL